MSQSNAGRVQVAAVAVAAILWVGSTATAVPRTWLSGVIAVGIPMLALLAAFHALFHEDASGGIERAVVGWLIGVAIASLAALSVGETTIANAANLALVAGMVALALAMRRS